MPLYEYHCKTCGETIELLQKDARVRETCGDDCRSRGATWGDGELVRKLSAHAVLSGGFRPEAAPPPSCGACGGAPGSCGEA